MSDKQLFFTTRKDEIIYLPSVTMVGPAKGLPPTYLVQGYGNLALNVLGVGPDERSKFVEAWKAALS